MINLKSKLKKRERSSLPLKLTIGGITSAIAMIPNVYFANTSINQTDVKRITQQYQESETDFDYDGLLNKEEERIGTNPEDLDSDGDGIDDMTELDQGTNPKINDPGFFIALNKKYLILSKGSESINQKTIDKEETQDNISSSGKIGLDISSAPKAHVELGGGYENVEKQSTQVETSYSESIDEYILNFSITYYNRLDEDIEIEKIEISPEYDGRPFHQTITIEENIKIASVENNPRMKQIKNYAIPIPKDVFEWVLQNPDGLEFNLNYSIKNNNNYTKAINDGERKCGKVVLYDEDGKAIDSIFIYGANDALRSIRDVLNEKYDIKTQDYQTMLDGKEIMILENNKDITNEIENGYDNNKEYHIVQGSKALEQRILELFNRNPSFAIEADVIGNEVSERISAKIKDYIVVQSITDSKEREYKVIDNKNAIERVVYSDLTRDFVVDFANRLLNPNKKIGDFLALNDEAFYIDDILRIPAKDKDHIAILGRYFSEDVQGETRIYELYSFDKKSFEKRIYYNENLYIEEIAIPEGDMLNELDSRILFIAHRKDNNKKAIYGIDELGNINKIIDISN
ncbi:MAG: hypothetical protein PWR30_258 [Candidatus Woesearchaeota archaeon]|nr:hypothetical protein [Candidatus Woesearchaeota archaeon]